jgi:periplasmic glucans biosynthesis protein
MRELKTHLIFGLITVLLLAIVIGSRRQEAFGYDDVVRMAELMAREGYMTASPVVPQELLKLDYDKHRDIRWKDERTLWRKEGLPFQVKFFHLGYLFDRPVDIFEIDGRQPERVRYSPEFFNFGQNSLNTSKYESLGYAGFRVHHPINKPEVLDEVLVFLGASYFRSVAKDLIYGPSARGLAIDTVNDKKRKEEFPAFTKFWLKKPDRYAKHITIYALMESRSVTGAYQFDAEPGPETRIHVRATLFFRKKTENIGYAPITSMYWFGENTSNTFGDFRPEVHDSDGLLMHHANGEWVWRPLSWSKQLQVNVFKDDGSKGFGLLQRDRDFNHYQDLEALYNKRPSVWVQTIKGFDKGSVKLLQLPTNNEYTDNVAVMWSPAESPQPMQPVQIEYVIRWFGEADDLPPVGRCVSTRVDYQDTPYYRHFFLEFAGGGLNQLKQGEVPVADIVPLNGGKITEQKVEWNDFNRSWRVSFMASKSEENKPIELACRLKQGDTALTETWSYTWMP